MLKWLLLSGLALPLLGAPAWAKPTPRIHEATALRAIERRLGRGLPWVINLSGPKHAFVRRFTAFTPGGLKDEGTVDMRVDVPHSRHWPAQRVKLNLFPERPRQEPPIWTGFRWIGPQPAARP